MDSRNKKNLLYQTNDYSIVSKYSAVKLGYHKDEILQRLIEEFLRTKSWRRTPLINRGYAARLLAVDWIVRRSIQFDNVDCFIVLGAGYNTLPFNLADKNCCWIELDLPQVVEAKSRFIREKSVLTSDGDLVQTGDGTFMSENNRYSLAACDLTDNHKLKVTLESIFEKIGRKKNIAIINEVCLCYIEPSDVEKILITVIDSVQDFALRVHYIGFEQVKPDFHSQFDDVMLHHFSNLGHPLKYFPTPSQIMHSFLNNLRFSHITISSMYQIYHNALMASTIETEAFHSEPFDEFEEMDLYLAHYALVTGVLILKDPFISSHQSLASNRFEPVENLISQLKIKVEEDDIEFVESILLRFGHASCLLETGNENSLLVSGGFGIPADDANQQHQRLSDTCIIELDQESLSSHQSISLAEFPSDKICLNRVHGQICQIPSTNLIFYNGGRQGPAKQAKCNVPFLANLRDNRLTLDHHFNSESLLCWRHKLCCMSSEKVVQVGGISLNQGSKYEPLIIWNLSASKLGFDRVQSVSNNEQFKRHSFGLDMRNPNEILIFGGLQADPNYKDKPVSCDSSAIIWDQRSRCGISLDFGSVASCYSSDIHFISTNEFVRIGGISTQTGQELLSIDTVDLRNMKCTKSIEIKPPEGTFTMLTNAKTCHIPSKQTIVSTGGGGNYFTFGTCFNRTHMIYKYK